MIKYLLTFLLIFTTLLFSSETKIETLKDLKPSPKKLPITFEAHGVKRIDNYYWMRDDSRKDPEIISHLNEENSYLENWFVSGNDFRESLFEEITEIPAFEWPFTYLIESRNTRNKRGLQTKGSIDRATFLCVFFCLICFRLSCEWKTTSYQHE